MRSYWTLIALTAALGNEQDGSESQANPVSTSNVERDINLTGTELLGSGLGIDGINGLKNALVSKARGGIDVIARPVGSRSPISSAFASPSVAYEQTPLQCICPDTFEAFGDQCERIVEFPQETLCARGSQLLSGECIRQQRPEQRCQYGFARVGQQCLKRNLAAPKLTCDDGFTLETAPGLSIRDPALVCIRQIAVETIPECPDGTPYQGTCHKIRTEPAKFQCEPGFEDVGSNACRKVERVRCHGDSVQPTGLLGLLGSLAERATAIGLGGKPRRGLASVDNEKGHEVDYAVKVVEIKDANNPNESASVGGWSPSAFAAATSGLRNGYSGLANDYKPWRTAANQGNTGIDIFGLNNVGPRVANQVIDIEETCTTNITIPAKPYCEIGEVVGNFCHVPVPVEPVQVCPAYGTLGDCFAFERQNPKVACPANFKQECSMFRQKRDQIMDCECVQMEQQDILSFCPPGFNYRDGSCVLITDPFTGCREGARSVGHQCQVTEVAPAICSYTVSYACQGDNCGSQSANGQK